MTALSVLIAFLGLGFLILVHEFGHFLVAKATGMRVEEFSIGFGRYLVSRRLGETVYGISALPLGGYVRVTGMHEEEFQARVDAAERRAKFVDMESRLTGQSAVSDDEVAQTPLSRRYYAKPVWQKVAFIVAGVGMNVVIAFVFLFFVGLGGYDVPNLRLSEVTKDSAAAVAGLKPGDRLISIDGQKLSNWDQVQALIQEHPKQQMDLVIERDGATRNIKALVRTRSDGKGMLGVAPEFSRVHPGFFGSVKYAGQKTYGLFGLIFTGLGQMITGKAPVTGPNGLAGPVGIISISSQAVRGGYAIYLGLLAFISVNLAILNMLPLLPLDGGHVLFSILEKILGHRISLRVFEGVSLVGIALFLLLAIVATSNDVGRLVTGSLGL